MFCKNGMKMNEHLVLLLNPETFTTKTISTIHRIPSNAMDWNTAPSSDRYMSFGDRKSW